MKRPSLLPLLLLLSLPLAARAEAPTTPNLVWVEPLPSALALYANLAMQPSDPYDAQRYRRTEVMVSGGYAREWRPGAAWTAELFAQRSVHGCVMAGGSCSRFTLARLSLGHAFSTGATPHTGWLLEPRLVLGLFREHRGHSDPDVTSPAGPTPASTGYSVQGALDVGYQWRVGGFYVAPVIGVSLGASRGMWDMALQDVRDAEVRDAWHFTATTNLVLLRMGWAF